MQRKKFSGHKTGWWIKENGKNTQDGTFEADFLQILLLKQRGWKRKANCQKDTYEVGKLRLSWCSGTGGSG